MIYKDFDFKKPNYVKVFQQRLAYLQEIRNEPSCLPSLKIHYRNNPWDFICDFGVTFDPRNAERGLPTIIPFILFPKQIEWIKWVVRHWKEQTPGLCEKSRDMGISWEAMSLACTLCLFYDGLAIGFGSRKEEYVDKVGTFKPLLPKARMFMENLPEEFRGGWVAWRDAPFMRINFPDTGSIITGEAGDQIGRGDRASIYMVDESAYLERPDLIEHSLSQTTNCRIDMSSVNGMNNPFAKKRHEGKIDVFVFDWRDDPRKDDKWYEKQCAELDPVTVAQEIDRDYSASVSGIVIPGKWVRAAIDAHKKLGIAPAGKKSMAFDVADEGRDKNAICYVHGTSIERIEEWSGKGDDIFISTEKVFAICDELGLPGFRYDADGLGAGVRGDARVVNARRRANKQKELVVAPFRGSEAVFQPDGQVFEQTANDMVGRTNKDYFGNRKAQGWWSLRRRFLLTHRWVVEGISCNPDEIISINSKMPLAHRLVTELSQPTFSQNNVGKLIINKKPDGMKSPNLADAVMIRYAPNDPPPLDISNELIVQVMRAGRGRRR